MKIDLTSVTLSEYDADGFIGCQIDAFARPRGTGGEEAVEALHPYGFASRPEAAESDGEQVTEGTRALLLSWGDERFVMVVNDHRTLQQFPQLNAGSSVQYCSKGSFFLLDSDDGTATLYVPYEFSGETPTKAHLFQMGKDSNGDPAIVVQHGGAAKAFLMLKDDSVIIGTESAYIEITRDGKINLNGACKAVGGLSAGSAAALPVLVGAPPGVPSPFLSG